LAPTYEKLAELYNSNSDFASKVTVAKIDATLNDVPDEIAGFPAIKLFPAGDKKSPVEYSGSRTLEDLANFIRDNGKHGIDAYADNDDDDVDMTDLPAGETMHKAAPAATTASNSASSGASKAATAASDSASSGASKAATTTSDSASSGASKAATTASDSASSGAAKVIKSAVSAAAEVVETFMADTDEGGAVEHDEL